MSSIINITDARKTEEANVINVAVMMTQREIYILRK